MKLTGVSHDGKLIVEVPKEMDDKELEIMIIASRKVETDSKEKQDKSKEEGTVENDTIM